MIELVHGKIRLALFPLREGHGRALLLLHGLGERSPAVCAPELDGWPGPVFALDFTGHGRSTVPRGGGYTPEVLMSDADAALAHLGEACVVGRGLGAYVAVLLAGGRPENVRGAILRDGPGLAAPSGADLSACIVRPERGTLRVPDPFALAELTHDIRPPDYAALFARLAVRGSGLDPALFVCARERPSWLAGVAREAGVKCCDLETALAACAAHP